jgi:methionine aminotransferase
LATYERFSDEPDRELALRLTREHGVASIPVSAFYQDATNNHMLRFCFCKKEETLIEACARLQRI